MEKHIKLHSWLVRGMKHVLKTCVSILIQVLGTNKANNNYDADNARKKTADQSNGAILDKSMQVSCTK